MDTNLVKIVILGIIQGITEFLPISSSGHLVVFQELFGMTKAPILVNVVLHGGSLLSIVCYYFKDILNTLRKEQRKVILLVLTGTAPAVVLLKPIKSLMDSAEAASESGSPVLLWVSVFGFVISFIFLTKIFRNSDQIVDAKDIDYKQAALIGVVQVLAVTPGVSRSGSTISTAGKLGIAPAAAAKYSFFLGIVAIGGACVLKLKDLVELYRQDNAGQSMNFFHLSVGFLVSFVVGYVALSFLIKVLQKGKLKYFGYYCLVMAVVTTIFAIVKQ